MKTAREMAFIDISKSLDKLMGCSDVWQVRPTHFNNSETYKLNKELGINKINYYGNKNGFKNKL